MRVVMWYIAMRLCTMYYMSFKCESINVKWAQYIFVWNIIQSFNFDKHFSFCIEILLNLSVRIYVLIVTFFCRKLSNRYFHYL